MSGGRSSSSNASNQTDKRIAQESGAAISGDGSSITINSVDGGIVARALDSVDASNATAGEGFTQLLGAAKELFNKGESLIGTTQKNVVDAYAQAKSNTAGTIDNRTLIVLAVAGAAAVFALRRK